MFREGRMRRVIVILVLGAALAACGPQRGAAPPASAVVGPAANVDLSHGVDVTGGGQPAFAPKYPGGDVVTDMTAAENGRHGGVFAFTTADPADRVFGWYRARAEAGGLTSQANVETAGARVYSARGPNGDVAVTAAPQDGGRTYVQVTWSAKG
jgi:hypothetical protein